MHLSPNGVKCDAKSHILRNPNSVKVAVRIEVRPTENDSTWLYKNGDISIVITCS